MVDNSLCMEMEENKDLQSYEHMLPLSTSLFDDLTKKALEQDP